MARQARADTLVLGRDEGREQALADLGVIARRAAGRLASVASRTYAALFANLFRIYFLYPNSFEIVLGLTVLFKYRMRPSER